MPRAGHPAQAGTPHAFPNRKVAAPKGIVAALHPPPLPFTQNVGEGGIGKWVFA